jgi:hypothetical protein
MPAQRSDPPGQHIEQAHALDRWSAHHWRDGLQVPSLSALERLLVRTRNHIYELIVLNPGRAEVMVRGGRFFPEFTRASVGGSSLGGGFLKMHGIYTGFCLELHAADQAIVTSPVCEIRSAADCEPT